MRSVAVSDTEQFEVLSVVFAHLTEQIMSSVLIFTTMEGNLGLITSSIATSLFTIMLVALDLLPDVA